MRTIKYERDETTPPINSNPFVAYSKNSVIVPKGIVIIVKTGLRIMDDVYLRCIRNCCDGIAVIAVCHHDGEVCLVVVLVGDSDMRVLPANIPIAEIEAMAIQKDDIRFVETAGGKRAPLCGSSAPVSL